MTKPALYAELKARTGKEEDVAKFPKGAEALVAEEPETIAWFAVCYDHNTFAIFDAFNDEAGRQAHLNGKVAAALMARAAELFETPPQIRMPEVLADKLPG
jgi:quinol monooxygenase YgiN